MKALAVLTALLTAAALNGAPPEFEAATVRPAAPSEHVFTAGSSTGGPGTSDPTTFRCSGCTLGYLITQAWALERYQFPGQSALPDARFDVMAKVAAGATQDQFRLMLQSLLQQRFALAGHFETKQMRGYEISIAKNGPKLKPAAPASADPVPHAEAAGAVWHSSGGGDHALSRPGVFVFGGQGRYRGDNQTLADLARVLSAQLMAPVEDRTGLRGNYDFTLTWADDGSHAATHPAGGFGFGDHADHATAPGASGEPTLIGAVQNQLGLRLEAGKATARVFVVDRVEKTPSLN